MASSSEALKSGDLVGGLGLSGFNFGTLGSIFLWIFIAVVVLGGIGGLIFWYFWKKSYSKQCWLFTKIGGIPMLKQIDRGKLMSFGMAGDKLMFLQKQKKFLPPPQIQMGKDIYWYWEREDGEYINFRLQDVDEVMKEAGAYYVDQDMRMQRLGIEKNLRDRMEKKSWMEKYGVMVGVGIFLVLITVCRVVLFSKLKDVSSSLDLTSQSVGQVATAIEKFYTKRVGGESPADTGLVPAIMLPLLWWRVKKWHQH
jgi:hypothetical protein